MFFKLNVEEAVRRKADEAWNRAKFVEIAQLAASRKADTSVVVWISWWVGVVFFCFVFVLMQYTYADHLADCIFLSCCFFCPKPPRTGTTVVEKTSYCAQIVVFTSRSTESCHPLRSP